MRRASIVATTGLIAALAAGYAGAGQISREDRAADLMNLLRQDCGSCHGLTMKGGLGPALLPATLADRDDDMLADIILDGIPDTPMPPWRPELTRHEALWLVDRLKEGLDQ